MKVTCGFQGVFAGACVAGLLALGPAAAADVIIDGAEENRTYDCQGGAAVINGGNNVLTLRNCTEVTVNGGDNLVDAGTARAISVLGSGNRVNYTTVPGRGKPKVVNLGTENEVGTIRAPKPDASGVDVVRGAVTRDGTAKVEGRRDGGGIEAEGGRASATGEKGIVLMENGRTETLDCKGGSATVVGDSNVLTLRDCREVSVTGNDNKVDAGDVTAISVAGRSNQVTWSQQPGGARPAVSNVGTGNVVKRRP